MGSQKINPPGSRKALITKKWCFATRTRYENLTKRITNQTTQDELSQKNKQVRGGLTLISLFLPVLFSTWHLSTFAIASMTPTYQAFPDARVAQELWWVDPLPSFSPSSNSKRYVGWMRLGHPRNHQLGGDKKPLVVRGCPFKLLG